MTTNLQWARPRVSAGWMRMLLGVGVFVVLCGVVFVIIGGGGNPRARIQVVDITGKPIAGAILKPDGIRAADGGHYGWNEQDWGIKAVEYRTDNAGFVEIDCPLYVRKDVGAKAVSFSVRHPDFVSDRPFADYAYPPPIKPTFSDRLKYIALRMSARAPKPVITLARGASLIASGYLEGDGEKRPVPVRAQVDLQSGEHYPEQWIRTETNIVSRGIGVGLTYVRLIHAASDGAYYFSEPHSFDATPGQLLELHLPLKKGIPLRGSVTPAPVDGKGLVEARVAHRGKGPHRAVTWTDHTELKHDGAFEFQSLPAGPLEVMVLTETHYLRGTETNGFVRPRQFEFTNDLSLTLELEPYRELRVTTIDRAGQPVPDVGVHLSPNIQWSPGGGYLFGRSAYRTADVLEKTPDWRNLFKSFGRVDGRTDSNGVAVFKQAPAFHGGISIAHPKLRPVAGGGGGPRADLMGGNSAIIVELE